MHEISNIQQLVKYIRGMLGEPLIQVELTDEHIQQIIVDTIKLYTDVVYGFFDDVQLVTVEQYASKSFRLMNYVEVTDVKLPDGKTSVMFKWDSIKRVLHLIDTEKTEHVTKTNSNQYLIFGQHAYHIDPIFDLVFNESWVKDFAKAKTQLLWGQVLGKYSQNLVGGATINYDRLISEAQSDIDRLMEELQEKWTDPAPVLVG